jgi:hypothetical protein
LGKPSLFFLFPTLQVGTIVGRVVTGAVEGTLFGGTGGSLEGGGLHSRFRCNFNLGCKGCSLGCLPRVLGPFGSNSGKNICRGLGFGKIEGLKKGDIGFRKGHEDGEGEY